MRLFKGAEQTENRVSLRCVCSGMLNRRKTDGVIEIKGALRSGALPFLSAKRGFGLHFPLDCECVKSFL